MAETKFDLIVVGGGPGGYVAAIRAAQLGIKTALVEREHLGGICLNWGCIPTKALLRTSEIRHLLDRLGEFGLSADNIAYDAAAVVKRSRKIANKLSKGVGFLMKKNKITVFDGEGRLAGSGKLAVAKDGKDVTTLEAKNIILATGARARALPDLAPDGKTVWSYKEAMVPEAIPKSLLVIGSGAIGMEFASFYSDMGTDVTVVEMLDRILPVEDEEISALARKAFEKQGIAIHTGATGSGLTTSARGAKGMIEPKDGGKGAEITVEKIILAVGIAGNVEDIGIEGTKVVVEKGHVVTDQWMATGEPGVFAIGDLCGPPWLAHKAMHEGVLCVEKIAGIEGVHPLDPTKVPGCTYCRPQVASVGFTEAAAKDVGHDVKVGRFPFVGNGKAIALGDEGGLVKTVFDAQTGELLGAHMIGPEVTELIQGYTIARSAELTEAELMATIFPHPTISEAMHEAVLDAYGRVLHI
jgi:dihydrolipoamide dehydrogenase